MIRLLIVVEFILLGFHGNSQVGNNILRCEVKSTLIKVPLTNGRLSEWRPFGDLDETMQTNIVFDFTKMKMYLDIKAKNNDKNFEGGIRVYDIDKMVNDTTYSDFGFASLKLSCTDEKKKVINYELIEFTLDGFYRLYLIDNSKNLKTKEELLVK